MSRAAPSPRSLPWRTPTAACAPSAEKAVASASSERPPDVSSSCLAPTAVGRAGVRRSSERRPDASSGHLAPTAEPAPAMPASASGGPSQLRAGAAAVGALEFKDMSGGPPNRSRRAVGDPSGGADGGAGSSQPVCSATPGP
eukprot:271860-Chlamydomonas_euryale.AAC.1